MVLGWLLGCHGMQAHHDYDRLCAVVGEEQAHGSDGLDARIAARLRDEVSPISPLQKTVLDLGGADGYAALQRQAADGGYPGWSCPAVASWLAARPAREPLPDDTALAHELEASDHPVETARKMLERFGERWYGHPVPLDLLDGRSSDAVGRALVEAGCPADVAGWSPADPRAAELLAACSPRGPLLLARHEVAASCTVGRAELALLLDAWVPAAPGSPRGVARRAGPAVACPREPT
jgi:hypothetical protein